MNIEKSQTLTLGIPAGRQLDWTFRILSRLESPAVTVEVLVARWTENPLTAQELLDLNNYFPTKEVLSQVRHAPAMRNAIIWEAKSTHLLFLDDDMVPAPDLLNNALQLAGREPNVVFQGIPYRVANSHSWLARTEGSLYKRGYSSYVDRDDNVTLLDARLMLAPVQTLRETPFDESLVFGGGEGRELTKSLREKGAILRLARELDATHVNRDTITALVEQKHAHGRGRGYQLMQYGPGKNGWLAYFASYGRRHYLEPVVKRVKGDLDTGELIYVWGTNTVFWVGVFEQLVRSKIRF